MRKTSEAGCLAGAARLFSREERGQRRGRTFPDWSASLRMARDTERRNSKRAGPARLHRPSTGQTAGGAGLGTLQCHPGVRGDGEPCWRSHRSRSLRAMSVSVSCDKHDSCNIRMGAVAQGGRRAELESASRRVLADSPPEPPHSYTKHLRQILVHAEFWLNLCTLR